MHDLANLTNIWGILSLQNSMAHGVGGAFLCLSLIIAACGANNSAEMSESVKRGEQAYAQRCLTCHMANGDGVPNLYPPLAKADYLMADKKRSIRQIIYGVKGPIEVNGLIYDSEMPAQLDITDQEVADVLNYIRNSWGNQGEIVLASEVLQERNEAASR